jgi:hypothetical protein
MIKDFLLFAIFSLSFTEAFPQVAQDIPIGEWRTHLSYNNVIDVESTADFIFAATEMGILILDRSDNSLSSLNKLNGLTGTGITAIGYEESGNQLIVGYEDGNIDFVHGADVVNFSRLKDLTNLTGSKRINDITVNGQLVFFSTDFGVAIYDLLREEIRETWRDLGATGQTLSVNQTIFFGDSVAVATAKGVLTGNVGDNLLDFTKWRRYDQDDLSVEVSSVAFFNNDLYAVVPGKGVYKKGVSSFAIQDIFGDAVSLLRVSSLHLLAVTPDEILTLSVNGSLNTIDHPLIVSPQTIAEDAQGIVWIADGNNGLVSNLNGDFNSFVPNGPSSSRATRIRFTENKIFAVNGGYNTDRTPLGTAGVYDVFENGLWTSKATLATDLTDICSFESKLFLASYGKGVVMIDEAGNETLYDASNSTLRNANTSNPSIYITSLTAGSKLWASNYLADIGLHSFTSGEGWISHPMNFSQDSYILKTELDDSENAWSIIDTQLGGGILVRKMSGEEFYLTSSQTAGDLPSRNVRSIAKDRDGAIWVGTDAGVAYFFSAEENAVRPIFENRFLLKDEVITAIAIDGGNRKWIGTQRGVWLFNPTGDGLIHNFTAENSPLLSNQIIDIAIHKGTGEVFFSTEKGIISFRSGATEENKSTAVKIFPNPVTSEFTGTIGFSGVATDAIVKVTDVGGRLIAEVRSNGNTATWNGLDRNGKRLGTGVYLVFASLPDGRETIVGKLAVIE